VGQEAGHLPTGNAVSGKRGRGAKRSPGSSGRAGWSAAQAAYRAVRLRDELLARYPGNPLVLRIEVGTRQDVIGQWVRVYRRAGLRKADALRRAAVMSGHTAPLEKGTTIGSLAELVMREAIERQGAALRRAELYVVSPAMHAAVAAAAATVTVDDLTSVTEDDVPAAAGFLLLPAIQMIEQPGRPYPDEILALSWLTRTMATSHRPALRVLELVAWVDGNGPIPVPGFVHGRRLAAQAGHPFPRLMPVHDTRLLLDAPAPDLTHPLVAAIAAQAKAVQPTMNADGVEVGEHHGETIEALADDWVRATFSRSCGCAPSRSPSPPSTASCAAPTCRPDQQTRCG
jgi:hypothetical protein